MDTKEIYTKLLESCLQDYLYNDFFDKKNTLALIRYCIENEANILELLKGGEK